MVNWTVFLPFQGIFITNLDKSQLRWVSNQDHTSHCHFCSMIDEFPVWNSELIKPWWWVRQFLLSVKRFHFPFEEIETLMIASLLYVSLGRECCLSGQIHILRLSKLIHQSISLLLPIVIILYCLYFVDNSPYHCI